MKSRGTVYVLYCLSWGQSSSCWTPSAPPLKPKKIPHTRFSALSGYNKGVFDISYSHVQFQKYEKIFSNDVVNGFVALSLVTALAFGGPSIAQASADTPAPGMGSGESINVVKPANDEGESPPEITKKSSEKALALSKKMKALNTRFYGAYWCGHCASQKEVLGKEAFENIQYVECSQNGKNSQAATLCEQKSIPGYPTWEINGVKYSGERSLDELETLVKMAEASSPSNPKAAPRILASSSDKAIFVSNQLADLNAKLYGAYWCAHTFDQKEALGKEAFERIPYVECAKEGEHSQTSLCKENNVKVVPTWEINGKLYEGERSLGDLENIISSELPLTSTTTTISQSDSAESSAASTSMEKMALGKDPNQKSSEGAPQEKLTDKVMGASTTQDDISTNTPSENDAEQNDVAMKTGDQSSGDVSTENGAEDSSALAKSQTSTRGAAAFQGEPSPILMPSSDRSLTSTESQTSEGKSPPEIKTESSEKALELASQLKEADAKLYGAYWCGYTNAQKERLGKEAMNRIRYVECGKDGRDSEMGLCRDKKIQGYPTWEIKGKFYPGDQEFAELEEILRQSP